MRPNLPHVANTLLLDTDLTFKVSDHHKSWLLLVPSTSSLLCGVFFLSPLMFFRLLF